MRLDAPGTLHHVIALRAGLVDTFRKLDWYRWSGHSVIMGHRTNSWQVRDDVLRWFGSNKKEARHNYRTYVLKSAALGKQPQLVGGGLVRSLGGWSQVKAIRQIDEKEASDERILGSGKFVEQIMQEAELIDKYRYTDLERKQKAVETINNACKKQCKEGTFYTPYVKRLL